MSDTQVIFQELYGQLNPAQKQAVETLEGPVLVVAGPGTGKTQLLSMRVANILRQSDAPASSILCLTFTESACQNMQKRLQTIVGRESYKVAIHTFHSFATEIIAQNPQHFFFGADYQPADKLAQYKILEAIFQGLAWDCPLRSQHPHFGFTYLSDSYQCLVGLKREGILVEEFRLLLALNQAFWQDFQSLAQDLFDAPRISKAAFVKLPTFLTELEKLQAKHSPAYQQKEIFKRFDLPEKILNEWQEINKIVQKEAKTGPLTEWKNQYLAKNNDNQLVPKDLLNWEKHQALALVYQKYEEEMHRQGLFDFEDMLLEVARSLENEQKKELLYSLQERYLYILVDEFQDTNGVQIRLLDNLTNSAVNEGNPNLMVVGDGDQAIFKFQGASVGNILNFERKYPGAKRIFLTQNYRSKQHILDLTNQIIALSQFRLPDIPSIVAAGS